MNIINANVSHPIGKPQAIPNCEEMHNANICIDEKTCLFCICENKGTDQLHRTSQCRFIAH